MDEFKEYVLKSLEVLHLKLHYKSSYDLNTSKGLTDRLKDLTRYDQLKEVVRENPNWSNEELSRELSERIRRETSLC